jgi:hypothetical protein
LEGTKAISLIGVGCPRMDAKEADWQGKEVDGKGLKGLGLADLEQQKTGRFKDIDSSLAGVPDVMG